MSRLTLQQHELIKELTAKGHLSKDLEQQILSMKVAVGVSRCASSYRWQETDDTELGAAAEKVGVRLPISLIHPLTKREVPVFAANYGNARSPCCSHHECSS